MSAMAAALRLLLLVGAARADATPEQLERLRAELPTALRGRYASTGDESEVRALLVKVMDPSWAPSGKWAEQLAALDEGGGAS